MYVTINRTHVTLLLYIDDTINRTCVAIYKCYYMNSCFHI